MTKDERIEKESELYRLHEGANPFETEVELKDRIAELEADLDVSPLGQSASERPGLALTRIR